MEAPTHAQQIEQSFTRQAPAFEDASSNRPFTADASWMLDGLPVAPGAVVLDVAAGTAQVARRLAGRAGAVIALDATPAMLAAGQAAAAAEGLRNVVFMRGEATALPFLDASFDVVVSRFAAHHLEFPGGLVAEMARCARPGGQVALLDLVAVDDPAIATEQNRLERLRDASHTTMLSVAELEALCVAAGLELAGVTARGVRRPLQPWLEHSAVTPAVATEIRVRLQAELDGGEPTGLRPEREDGELWFTQTFAALIARRPA